MVTKSVSEMSFKLAANVRKTALRWQSNRITKIQILTKDEYRTKC